MPWTKNPAALLTSLLVIHVLAHIDRNMLLGFSPQIMKDLALDNTQYGFLVGAVWVLSFGFMATFMGTLADRFSRTRIIAAGVFIWSICTWASGHARSFEEMAIARFFVASGEAALVPAAVGLLVEAFSERRRGTAIGVFFTGIPLGIGLSFLLAGSIGQGLGWRSTFTVLGVVGVLIALSLAFLREERGSGRDGASAAPQGKPFASQVAAVCGVIARQPALRLAVLGFVLANAMFASFSFTQLWMVRERGLDAAGIARTIGGLQIVFGMLGAVGGGALSDRFSKRFAGGHASFMVLLILLCAPLMLAYRFAPAGSALFYLGMCSGFFLPLAIYGPANTLIQGLTPESMRSTIAGVTMLLINVFAIAIGSLAIGFASDRLAAAGNGMPLTTVLLASDVLAIGAALLFWRAARHIRREPGMVDVAAPTTLAH